MFVFKMRSKDIERCPQAHIVKADLNLTSKPRLWKFYCLILWKLCCMLFTESGNSTYPTSCVGSAHTSNDSESAQPSPSPFGVPFVSKGSTTKPAADQFKNNEGILTELFLVRVANLWLTDSVPCIRNSKYAINVQ